MQTTNPIVLNYEDYAALPADSRQRYEIHKGKLSVTPAPNLRHQRILGNLNEIVRGHVTSRSLGEVFFAPVDVILDETTIVQPDLIYLDAARLDRGVERGIEGAPTLVVEVVSPSTTLIDRRTKFGLYAEYGVPFYWVVDFEARAIEAYAPLSAGTYQLACRASGSEPVALPPFPDLALVPTSIWP